MRYLLFSVLFVVFSFSSLSRNMGYKNEFRDILKTNNQKGTTIESKIKQLNELFEGQYKIDFSKGQLTASLIKNGSVFRQDKMYLETLDPNDITYIKEEGAIILKCRQDLTGVLKRFQDGCIDRTFMERDIRRAYSRVNFDIPENSQKIEEIRELLSDLIKMAQPEK